MITPETARDLDVLQNYPPIVDTDGEDARWLRATPCVRLTFVADGNMTDRSARLDDWLASRPGLRPARGKCMKGILVILMVFGVIILAVVAFALASNLGGPAGPVLPPPPQGNGVATPTPATVPLPTLPPAGLPPATIEIQP